MSLVNTIWLWGLLALLIPLTIHLLSRQETRILPFGSLRFLQESSSSQSRSIQLTDVGLMLLRMLIFLLFVLFIVGFSSDEETPTEKWLVLGDSIKLPEAFRDQGYQIHKVSDLSKTTEYLNQWYFLQDLSQNYPEIDSLIWIDNFENQDFWGAVPPLSYRFKLIDDPGNEAEEDLAVSKQDSVVYSFREMAGKDQDLFNKIISTNQLYLDEEVIFYETSDENAPVQFTNKVYAGVPLQFVIEESTETTVRIVETWPSKTVFIAKDYLENKLLYDELLMLVTEHIAQYLIPQWKYNDWHQATELKREMLGNNLAGNVVKSKNEVLLWIIIAVFLLERFWVYQKRNG